MTSTPATTAARLERLIEVMHPRDRGPFTPAEIVEAVRTKGAASPDPSGPAALTLEDLAALRAGRPTSATQAHLDAIADCLHVPRDYFTHDDKAAEITEQMRLVELLRLTKTVDMRVCGGEMSRAGVIAVLEKLHQDQLARAATGGT